MADQHLHGLPKIIIIIIIITIIIIKRLYIYIYRYIHIFRLSPGLMSEVWSDQNINYCTISNALFIQSTQVLLSQEIGGEYTNRGRDRRVQTSCLLYLSSISASCLIFLGFLPLMPFLSGLLVFIIFFTYFRGVTFPSMLNTPSVTINFRRAPSASLSFSSRSNEGYNEYNTLVNQATQTWSGDSKTNKNYICTNGQTRSFLRGENKSQRAETET